MTKQQYSLPNSEVDILQSIQNVESAGDETIRSLFPKDSPSETTLDSSWSSRLSLDSVNLEERILTCKDIKDKVGQRIRQITQGVEFREFKIAEIKGISRALVKLQQYIDKRIKANKPISSAV